VNVRTSLARPSRILSAPGRIGEERAADGHEIEFARVETGNQVVDAARARFGARWRMA
jgi:hypothetical protein